MQSLRDRETGVMFWAGRDRLDEICSLGVRCGQIGFAGDVPFTDALAAEWKTNLEKRDFRLVTAFAAYTGECYADIPTVQRTVGFIPRATRDERERRTLELSDFAAAIGVHSIACHIGFVPEDTTHPDYRDVLEIVRRVADHAAKHRQTFALETGQEPAHVLLKFLRDVNRPNLGINFDPANMILYGSGEPIEALEKVGRWVHSVHCKDGTWAKHPGQEWGAEVPLGEGDVGMERYLRTLDKIGYRGPLTIEREIPQDPARQKSEIGRALTLLRELKAKIG